MDMKKVLVLGLFLVVAVSAVAAISATEELTLDGIQFKIPDGYNVVEKSTDTSDSNDKEDIDGTPVDTEVNAEYKNAAGDKLEFKVGTKNNGKIDSINPANAQKKQIAGKDGFLIKEVDDGKDKYNFEYLQDGKLVKITAVSEDIISQVIV
ncbi:hypothetical protein [uncultured Methanobrevibacter sp.]|uniref:hypothetical protein n=1 Tax=uncultured Methanobrevibacter sp. TaxID=253161 RepID=UPI0025E369FB|nr:hypothetical protein [uncultured Methanobrevibacter sp.]